MVEISPNLTSLTTLYTIKKAAVVLNFCLIGKIHHNFLVPIMIQSDRKTFMPVQSGMNGLIVYH